MNCNSYMYSVQYSAGRACEASGIRVASPPRLVLFRVVCASSVSTVPPVPGPSLSLDSYRYYLRPCS